jgi:CHAT domain-containing protein
MLRIRNLPLILIALFLLYVFINLELFFWNFFNPAGFWGIIWFYFFSFVLFASFFIIWDLVDVIVMMRRIEKTSVRNLILISLFLLISTGVYYGGAIVLPWIFYNRYKYIERSENFFSKGRFEDALKYSEKILKKTSFNKKQTSKFWILPYTYEISKKGRYKSNFRYYQAAINHAYCLQASGQNNEKADELYNQLISFSKKKFADKKEFLIIPLMGRAMIYIAEGQNVKAENCFEELTYLVEDIDKSDVDNMVQTLLFYSIYAQKNGDFEKSVNLRKQAQEIYFNSGQSLENSTYLSLALNVASDYLSLSKYDEAKEILKENQKTARKRKDKLIYLDYLRAKSQIAEFDGDLQQAEKFHKDILKRIKKNQGSDHIDYGTSLYDLAIFYFRNSRYEDAKKIFEEALSIASNNIVANRLVYFKILLGKILNDYKAGELEQIENQLSEIEDFLYNQINDNFLFLAEDEREKYILALSGQIDLINSIYIGLNKPKLKENIYNNVLSTKSIALQSNQHLKQLIINSGNPDLVSLYNSIIQGKSELYAIDLSDLKNQDLYNVLADSILKKEKKLLKIINSFSEFKKFDVKEVNWKNVQSTLKDNEAAIEYINLPEQPTDYSTRIYYALIIKHGSSLPELVRLFKEEEVVALLDKAGNTKEKVSAIYSGENIENLYNLIWSPIEKEITGIDKIYVSLSGILHKISFPAILEKRNEEIVFVGSTRSIAETRTSTITGETLSVMYGNIDYEELDSFKDFNKVDMQKSYPTEIQRLVLRSGFDSLPNTKYEIENISRILQDKNYETKVYTGKSATEESFKELSNTNTFIIHLATHGYYFPIQKSSESNKIQLSVGNSSVINNPLFRTGLLMAGANQVNKPFGSSDGLLTAFEISKTDLHDVDLVVLSACETGLGDLMGSEGVFGLQRAFKLAGVKSIIMSLWKVEDEKTSELMQLFYKYYVSGYSKQKSLALAQEQIKNKYENPFYWAAFVVVE